MAKERKKEKEPKKKKKKVLALGVGRTTPKGQKPLLHFLYFIWSWMAEPPLQTVLATPILTKNHSSYLFIFFVFKLYYF